VETQLHLTLSNSYFCHPHTPQLLFILGGKDVGGLLVIIIQFKREKLKQKEYNLLYLLAKVRTTCGRASETGKS
jgi:hypothetical protein